MIKKFIKRWPVTFYNFIFASVITGVSIIVLPCSAPMLIIYIFSMFLAVLLDVRDHRDEASYNQTILIIKDILNREELSLKMDPADPESKLRE